jgi:hypothetical protein
VNAADDLHDVTLRDFVLDGSTTFPLASHTPDGSDREDNYVSGAGSGAVTLRPFRTDPNQDRRQRASEMAPSRAGIIFNALHDGQMSNLHFEHLTVRHCTRDGVAIRGATGVVVEACDFSDNGGSVVPGPGLEHNLLLSHVADCRVAGSRLDDSPWGSGLDVAFGTDLVVTNNEMARNTRDGLHLAESNKLRISGNVTEGNDRCGIALAALMDGCRQVEISGNLTRNNGDAGISMNHVNGGSLKNNFAAQNGGASQIAVKDCTSIRR